MSKYVIDENTLTAIAGAIRAKKGSDEKILTEKFASEINEIGNKDISALIDGSITEMEIPESITEIGTSAFQNRKELTKVVMGENIKRIKGYAFSYCSKLSEISVPDTVTSIDNHAFYYCEKLMDFPVGVNSVLESIGESAFYTCRGFKNIQMPKSLKTIGNQAFYNCSNCLTYDFSNHTSVPEVGTNAFFGINLNAKIVVPENLYDDFCRHTSWGALQGSLVSIAKVKQYEYVPLETVWILGEGEYRYVTGVSAFLKAFYKINDGDAVEFDYYNPAFGAVRFTQMYDGDTGYIMTLNNSLLYFSETGTYEIWVEDESGNKLYRRILEVS